MAIENLGISTDNWDNILVHIISNKLHQSTILDYENKLEDIKEPQSLKHLLNYIEKRFLSWKSAERKSTGQSEKGKNSEEKTSDKKFEKKYDNNESKFTCNYCEKQYSIYKCNEFEKLDPEQRNEWVKSKKICFNCLQAQKFGECQRKYVCKKEKRKQNRVSYDDQIE